MYELRSYQQEAVNKGIEFFANSSKKNVVIVSPTGSGKSLIIANIAKALNGHTIVFQPSKELLEQNYEKYISFGEVAEIYSASMNQKSIGQVTFATIGSVVNKPELFNEFQYCIVDECDLVSPKEGTMYKSFFDKLNLKVLGLTATPIRMKRYNYPEPYAMICMLDRMRPRFFSEYIYITQIKELYDRGYFAEIEYFNYDFDNSRLRINSTGGGISTEKDYSHYKNLQYRLWREEVFKRDNWLCQICKTKKKGGEYLHPHHIKLYAYYPDSRYDVENGVTLCSTCHRKLHSENWGKQIVEVYYS